MNEEVYALATAARQPLLEHIKAKGFQNVCSIYSVVYKDRADITTNTACYANLLYEKDKHTGKGKWEPLALVLYRSELYSGEPLNDVVRITYLKWLLNESPWAAAFVDKDAKEVFDSRIVTVETDIDGRILGGACVGFRRMWEYTQIVQTWFDLAVRGVNKNLAYYIAFCARGAANSTLDWRSGNRGHVNLNHYNLGKKGVLNFVKGTPVGDCPTYKVLGSYKSYSEMFNANEGEIFAKWVDTNFPYKDEEPTEVVNKNPFAKAKVVDAYNTGPTIAYEKGIERMVEFSKTILKEIGYDGP